MKRLLFTLATASLIIVSAHAQKTKTESFSETQARMVEVTARSYVRPLAVNLVVNKGQQRKTFSHLYPKTTFEVAMRRDLENLKSRAIYDASNEWNCDAVVAATFKIELTEDENSYLVEMKGFPANFDSNSWHPIGTEDFQWLQIDKAIGSLDKNSGVVINEVKKR